MVQNLALPLAFAEGILQLYIGILIVLFVKFNSSEVYSILTSEVTSEGDDEHETETTGCLSKLNTLRATLEAKKRELKTLRTARKKNAMNS